MKHKIELSLLHRRLCKRANYAYSKDKWNVLLYGWRKKYNHSAAHVKKGWLSKNDAVSLSEYVGYDLL